MLIEITTTGKVATDVKVIFKENDLMVLSHGVDSLSHASRTQSLFTFFTQEPILHKTKTSSTISGTILLPEDLNGLQNEVSGMVIGKEGDLIDLLAFSARISRSRLYFLIKDGSLFLSDDLRDLLPYSKRKLRKDIAYGIVKFGEAPEYHTVVEDIFCIPGGCYLRLNTIGLENNIVSGVIPESFFLPYFQIKYTMTGGDLVRTELKLMEVLQELSPFSPGLLVSGGIDSTLLNFLFDKVVDSPYPAIFLDFREAPGENEYARRSVQGTKAEWIPVTVSNESFLEDFKESIASLVYPVYDNGSVFAGHQLKKHFLSSDGRTSAFIDGTLADSCYGVRDYNAPLTVGKYQPEFYSLLKEWIYVAGAHCGIQLGGTKPRDSFLKDEFLQDLLWYGGPFINTFFRNSRKYTEALKEKYYHYTNFLHPDDRSKYWPVYTILKLLLYAGKQTTVKTYDALLPHQVYYPFMFESILEDQGRYTWEEKSEGGVVKAPLKRILEKYIDKSFIYRKKSGLQSQTRRWLLQPDARAFVIELLGRRNGIAEAMMGSKHHWLATQFRRKEPIPDLVSLALSLSVIQYWCDIHKIEDFS